jgi:hypothetical protein
VVKDGGTECRHPVTRVGQPRSVAPKFWCCACASATPQRASLSARTSGEACVTGVVCMAAVWGARR